jgi:hypothetical protein
MPFQDRRLEGSAMADNKSKTPFYLIDTQSAFYKPLGRRITICVAVVLWAVLEAWHRDAFWSVISGACAIYCVYVLLWSYTPPIEPPPRPPDPEDDEDAVAEAKDDVSVAPISGPAESEEKPKP